MIYYKRERAFYAFGYLLLLVLLGGCSYYVGQVAPYWRAFMPSNYYEVTLKMPVWHVLSWILLPALLLLWRSLRCFSQTLKLKNHILIGSN